MDERKLNAKANDNTQDQQRDKYLEDSQTAHCTFRSIEEQDGQHVKDRQRDTSYDGQLRDQQVEGDGRADNLAHIGSDDGHLGERIEKIIEPSGQEDTVRRCKVQARNASELNCQTLQQDGEEVAKEHNEEQLVFVGSAGRNVGSVVSGVN